MLSSCWDRVISCCCCKGFKQAKQDHHQDIKEITIIENPGVKKVESEVDFSVNSNLTSAKAVVRPEGERFIALFDYTARTKDDLTFNTRDILEILDSSTGEWWMARAITGISAGESGYIPANYVALKESIDAEPWYYKDTKRLDAERLLLAEENRQGAFLLRTSKSLRGALSLSVLHQGKVKHYQLEKLDNGYYCVSKNKSFPTLKEFVEYYSRQSDGLCGCLGDPCRKTEAPQTYSLSYNTVDQWEIDRSSIKLLNKLGSGQFGEVFEGVWNDTTSVAVKILETGVLDRAEILAEAQLMKKLRHPKLIQLYAVCTIEEPIYIITELMTNGNLLENLRKDKGATLHIWDRIEMAAQVAAGMAYLEQHNYIHRDLAARNVLVGENNDCKVANFGLARVLMRENENIYNAREGSKYPIKWTAPEAINYNKFTIKSDVWSFGILLYEIMTFGELPYPGLTNTETVESLAKGNRMSCPPKCPKPLHNIMMDCWKEKEQERPTFQTLQWQLEDMFEMDMNSYDDY
ncbi:tyrosine-protein kinase SRK2-like [Cyprinodon tularosa]|uniref:tyrosine-protein kinase SRK2-like n=1 Tax=Cyprinodon tularosa TaxID=77115 RepID=UPI0018E257C5|nr:tyrosine-protein kinase SRK2-like [Cyprinodon tularosa]